MTGSRYASLSVSVLFSLLFALSSCKKSSSDSPSSGFNATIDAAGFETLGYNALYTPSTNQLDITGVAIHNSDSVYLYVIIPDNILHTPIDTRKEANITYYDVNKSFMYDSYADFSHGTLTVTKLDLNNKVVSGTFSGVLYAFSGDDSVTITDGHFNTPFVIQ